MSLMFLQKGFKVYYNELNKGVFLFFKFILNNDFPDYFYDFIGRDEFFKIIKSEPKTEEEIIRKTFTELCYSFGNKKTSYFVAKEKEELAKQKHLFVYNKAKTIPLLESRYDITGLSYFIPKLKTNNIEQTRLNLVNVVLKLEAIKCCIEYRDLNVKNFFSSLSFEEFLAYKQVDLVNLINKYCPDIPKKPYQPILKEIKALKNVEQVQQIQNIERLKQIKQIKSLNETFHVEELQRINILNSVKNVENKQNLILLNHSYEDKQIDEIINSYNEDELIIYLDPPYFGSDYYGNKQRFNYDKFKTWQKSINKQFFLSEYNNVYDLIEVTNFDKKQQFHSEKSKIIKERLFTNKIIKTRRNNKTKKI